MRRVIRKEIRRRGRGVDVAADVNIVVSTGEGEKTHTTASSRQTVEQRSQRDRADERPPDHDEKR